MKLVLPLEEEGLLDAEKEAMGSTLIIFESS
jgi:hypothetical protein